MINKKVEKAFNDQINAEIYSSYLYLSMSAYFDSLNLAGFGSWMRVQAQEELVHAMKFFTFIRDRGGRVTLAAIEGPATKWDSPLKAFEDAYKHETKVTERINNLVDLATQVKDHASVAFLQWFVTEQVEEEASADAVIKKLTLIKDSAPLLLMLDRELAARTFQMPPTAPAD